MSSLVVNTSTTLLKVAELVLSFRGLEPTLTGLGGMGQIPLKSQRLLSGLALFPSLSAKDPSYVAIQYLYQFANSYYVWYETNWEKFSIAPAMCTRFYMYVHTVAIVECYTPKSTRKVVLVAGLECDRLAWIGLLREHWEPLPHDCV